MGADGLGEAELLPFSHVQTGGLGSTMLTVGANAHRGGIWAEDDASAARPAPHSAAAPI